MIRRLVEWVCRDIDWYGFARTRGGWVDAHGRLADPPEDRPEPTFTVPGGFCAPMTSYYSFGPSGRADHWDPWVEWHPPRQRLADLMPVIRVQRGAIRYGTP